MITGKKPARARRKAPKTLMAADSDGPAAVRSETDLRVAPGVPHLWFRFWCGAGGGFVEDYNYSGAAVELLGERDDILIPSQCTGIRDFSGEYVFEGDVLIFENGVIEGGGLAAGVVLRDPRAPSNMHVRVGSTSEIVPLECVCRGVVSGHIYH